MNPPPRAPTYEREEPVHHGATPNTASLVGGDDRDLIRRMAAGDERALGELYDRWVRLVSSLVLQLLGDADEAEDVVEETFWQAWRQAARYESSRGAVSTWLTTIARSRAIDRLRANRRRQEEVVSEVPHAEAENLPPSARLEGDPLAGAVSREQRERITAALQKLPVEQREAIELAYFGGLSQSEIADRTKQPLGTVKTRVRLAMEKLRESLSMLHDGTS